MVPIIMPQVGQDIPKAKITQWLKRENDPVQKDEVVAVVESEKASFELEAEASGVLLKILHREGEEVEILTPIGYIGQPEEASELSAPSKPGAEESAGPKAKDAQTKQPPQAAGDKAEAGHLRASPIAKRLAEEHGVNLKNIKGTGPGNRIIKRDVLAAVSAVGQAAPPPAEKQPAPDDDTTVPFSRMRKAIAKRLTLSKQTIPHFYLAVDVDMTEALKWRKAENEKNATRITVTDIVIKATASALVKFPRLNAYVDSEEMTLKKDINVGVAVSVEDGLLVPIIPNADGKSLAEISELSRANAEAARAGTVDLKAKGTFTISTLGMYSVREFFPIINPPQCAILGIGSAERRAVPVAGKIGIRDMMTLTLACDHRAADGVYAAQFLNEIRNSLQSIS
ncbi:MAG: dihydrolipoamide acetyltransferase family protein [Planctomycetota bacterium]|nr:dihydrolipoamide acetyltransferase family protein [Planctomycetota bacterium]